MGWRNGVSLGLVKFCGSGSKVDEDKLASVCCLRAGKQTALPYFFSQRNLEKVYDTKIEDAYRGGWFEIFQVSAQR